jgi:hypothetical protein
VCNLACTACADHCLQRVQCSVQWRDGFAVVPNINAYVLLLPHQITPYVVVRTVQAWPDGQRLRSQAIFVYALTQIHSIQRQHLGGTLCKIRWAWYITDAVDACRLCSCVVFCVQIRCMHGCTSWRAPWTRQLRDLLQTASQDWSCFGHM